MNDDLKLPDPAAVFGCALSLWKECEKLAQTDRKLNLSDCFNGMDECMRVMMDVATRFENWADMHVAFEKLDDVWPYMMENCFGAACLFLLPPTRLAEFDEGDCLRVALQMRLPVRFDTNLPLPVGEIASNPLAGSEFSKFRIVTMRESRTGLRREPLTFNDDPFDEQFGPPFLSLYGIGVDGRHEHIADRGTYAEAVNLARKLVPGIEFTDAPQVFYTELTPCRLP